jgi:uncharacterized membrane protein
LHEAIFHPVSTHGFKVKSGGQMKSRAAIMGHPLHPIFVTIPIGLWSFSPICDLVYHAGWGDDSWKKAALYCLAGGIVGAIPAFITGWIDYSLCATRDAARVAKFHLICNIVTTLLITLSVGLRFYDGTAYSLIPVAISFAGVVLAGISGWLGGELVSTHGISVKGFNEPPSGER